LVATSFQEDLGVNQFAYRDKKVVGVFVRFRALQKNETKKKNKRRLKKSLIEKNGLIEPNAMQVETFRL
jgi:hypothetical protein